MFILWKFKKLTQKSIFPQKIQKSLCITTKSLEQIQTQLSQKLQRFRTCRNNKKCSIFHDLSEYIIFHMIVTYWTGPLRNDISKLQTESGRSKKAPKYFKTYHTPVFGVEKHEFEVRFLIRLNHTEIRGYALQNIG